MQRNKAVGKDILHKNNDGIKAIIDKKLSLYGAKPLIYYFMNKITV